MQNAAAGCEITGNTLYGFGAVERPGNYCSKSFNQVLAFSGLPVIVWPPIATAPTETPIFPSVTDISSLTVTPDFTPVTAVVIDTLPNTDKDPDSHYDPIL